MAMKLILAASLCLTGKASRNVKSLCEMYEKLDKEIASESSEGGRISDKICRFSWNHGSENFRGRPLKITARPSLTTNQWGDEWFLSIVGGEKIPIHELKTEDWETLKLESAGDEKEQPALEISSLREDYKRDVVQSMLNHIRTVEPEKQTCAFCQFSFMEIATAGLKVLQLSCKKAWYCTDCMARYLKSKQNLWDDINCPYRHEDNSFCDVHGKYEMPESDLQRLGVDEVKIILSDKTMKRQKAMEQMEANLAGKSAIIPSTGEPEGKPAPWDTREYAGKDEDGNNKAIDKHCPFCYLTMGKTEACNHMTCPRVDCGFQFCWLCGKRYKQNDKVNGKLPPKGFCDTHCQHASRKHTVAHRRNRTAMLAGIALGGFKLRKRRKD